MEGILAKKERSGVRKCVGGLRQVRSEGVDGGGSKIGGRWRGEGGWFRWWGAWERGGKIGRDRRRWRIIDRHG